MIRLRFELGIGAAFLLLSPGAFAQSAEGAEIVSLELRGEESSCAVPVPWCLVDFDDNSTLDPGDDSVHAQHAWEALRIAAHPEKFPIVGNALAPFLPTGEIATDPKEWSIPLPIIDLLGNQDTSIIDPLEFDSVVAISTANDWLNWSIAGTLDDGLYYGGDFYLNRTHLRPVPFGFTLGPEGSDALVRALEHKPCPAREGRKLDRMCDLADATLASIFAATPALDAGATVPRAGVQPNAPAPSSLASAPPSTRSALFPVAQAPDALARGATRDPAAPLPLPRDPARHLQPEQPAPTEAPATLVTARATEPQSAHATPVLVVAAAAAAAAIAALAGLPLWRLYKRVQDRDLPRQETRAALLTYVREHPGARLQETADAVGVQRNAIVYHARRLARANSLVIHAETGITRFFLPGIEPPHATARTPLDHPVARDIVLEIARAGALARRALRERVPAPHRTVDWHLARLQREGIIATKHGVRGAAFSLAEGMREATIERAMAGGATTGAMG